MDTPQDIALIQRAARGDRAAFRDLYRAHLRAVTAQVGRMLGPGNDVEGVVQEVFIQTYQSLHRFRFESRFSTWLRRITRNVTIDHLRRHPPAIDLRGLRALADHIHGAPDADPLRRLTARDRLRHLYAALADLPLHQREAFIAFELEGMSLAELAALTDTSIHTAASRVRRARERLRAVLKHVDAEHLRAEARRATP